MPSRIDRGARFDRITEATARVVAAEGVAAASLRRVAAEAGLPLHALRHLCPDTGTVHQRTVKWLRRKLAEDQHVVYPDPDDLADILRRTLAALVPSGDEAVMRARAWAAWTRAPSTSWRSLRAWRASSRSTACRSVRRHSTAGCSTSSFAT